MRRAPGLVYTQNEPDLAPSPGRDLIPTVDAARSTEESFCLSDGWINAINGKPFSCQSKRLHSRSTAAALELCHESACRVDLSEGPWLH